MYSEALRSRVKIEKIESYSRFEAVDGRNDPASDRQFDVQLDEAGLAGGGLTKGRSFPPMLPRRSGLFRFSGFDVRAPSRNVTGTAG
jgi:hypothetical protein